MASRVAHSARALRSRAPPPLVAASHSPPRRTLFGWGKTKLDDAAPPKPLLTQDNLFHPLSQSPFPEMRAKGDRIRQLAYCPVSQDQHGDKVHVAFECPDCGFPTHASEQRWREDPNHGRYWPRLREANEDEHDLRSGRELTEFRLPGPSSLSLYLVVPPSRLGLTRSRRCPQANSRTRRPSRSATGTSSCTRAASPRSRPSAHGDTSPSS